MEQDTVRELAEAALEQQMHTARTEGLFR